MNSKALIVSLITAWLSMQPALAAPQANREQAMMMFTGMTAGMVCSMQSGLVSTKLAEVTLQETMEQHGIRWLYDEARTWTPDQERRFFKRVENLTETVGGCEGLFRMSAAYLDQMGD